MKKVRIVSATTKNESDFWQRTLLGQSFNLIPKVNIIDINILFNNVGNHQKGLSSLYNLFLQSEYQADIYLDSKDSIYAPWQVNDKYQQQD